MTSPAVAAAKSPDQTPGVRRVLFYVFAFELVLGYFFAQNKIGVCHSHIAHIGFLCHLILSFISHIP
jgi:hypothetical protein